MPGPYRDDLEAVRERVRQEERANARPPAARPRVFEPARIAVAVAFLAIGGVMIWQQGPERRPTRFAFASRTLDQEELAAPLEEVRATILDECIPPGGRVAIDVTVQYGHSGPVTVWPSPGTEHIADCVFVRVGKARWPYSPHPQRASASWSRE